MGVFAIGNRDETLMSRYEETEARLKKIQDAGYKGVSIWGCEFRKLLVKILTLKINFARTPMWKILQ